MKSANIPDVLGVKADKTLTAASYGRPDAGPLSPFSQSPMVEAHCGKTPVYIDQVKRIVMPKRVDR